MGIMVKALAIFLRSANSTFAPSGWFMHAWSHIYIILTAIRQLAPVEHLWNVDNLIHCIGVAVAAYLAAAAYHEASVKASNWL